MIVNVKVKRIIIVIYMRKHKYNNDNMKNNIREEYITTKLYYS